MLEEESDSDTEGKPFSDEFLAYGIENTDSKEQDWIVQVNINDIPFKYKKDTGAQCNVITEKLCKEAGIKEISKSKSRLASYAKDEVKTIGRTHFCI